MKVVGALLAGGESRRMGRDKAGVIVDGQTLAERALAVLGQVSDAQVILGHGRGCPTELPRLPDVEPGAGPSAGLRALLASGLGDRYVVLPVDMPGVRAEHLAALLAACAHHRAACFVRGSAETRTLEPLPCVLDAGARLPPHLRSLQALLRENQPALVPLSEQGPDPLRNLNHPEDLP